MERDIIFGGLYLSRVIQFPFMVFGVIEDKCRSFRDDIFYGCRLARGGILFNLICVGQKRNAAGKRYTVSHRRSFVFKEKYGR